MAYCWRLFASVDLVSSVKPLRTMKNRALRALQAREGAPLAGAGPRAEGASLDLRTLTDRPSRLRGMIPLRFGLLVCR